MALRNGVTTSCASPPCRESRRPAKRTTAAATTKGETRFLTASSRLSTIRVFVVKEGQRETDLPAQQPKAQEDTRLSRPDEYERGSACPFPAPQERAQAPRGVTQSIARRATSACV